MNHQLSLITLGPPALRTAASTEGALIFGPSKPLALIAYLAFAVGRRASRDRLLDLLWGDMDPERARRTLRQTTWQIRHRLGNEALVGERDELTLCLDLSTDRDDFLAALATGDLELAVRLYTGSFFTSFAAPGAVEFEHWADLERERLRANYRQALEALARRRMVAGRFRDARQYATALRDDDPAREASWRLLFECLLAAGDSWNAGVEAASLERLLADSGRRAEPATRRLLATAREDGPAAAPLDRSDLDVELIGRETEFATILEAWERVREGAGRHLRLVAAPGLGKTRLLREVRNRLAAGGARVVLARAQPAERHLAYACAAEIARRLSELPGAIGVSPDAAAALVALAPATSSRLHTAADPATGDEALRRRTLAVREVLAAVSEEQPLAMLVDDAHWADPTSSVILAALLHRLGDLHVLVVTAERPGLGADIDTPNTLTLTLPAFTASECEDVMTSCGALPNEPWARGIGARLAETTGGSPLLLLETLQLCLDSGLLELEGSWHCAHPEGLESALASGSAVRRRIEALDQADADLLSLVACAGTPVGEERLTAAATKSRSEIAPRLALLERHGFVALSGGAAEVSHDEIAAAALARLTEEGLRDAHRRLGLALLADQALALHEYPLATDHLVRGGAEEQLDGLYARYLRAVPGPRARKQDEGLARAMLGEHTTAERVGQLLASRPWVRRLGPAVLGVAAGVLLILAAAAMLLPRSAGPASKATRTALVVAPFEADPTLIPSPVIEIQDDEGRRVPWAQDSVYVDVQGGRGQLAGRTSRRAQNGRATFDGLDLILPDSVRRSGQPVLVRFWARGLRPTAWSATSSSPPTLFLERGTLNGQALAPPDPGLVVEVGDSIVGDLHLRYSSPWSAASVMLGGTPTWGDKRASYFTIKPLVTPLKDGRQHVAIRLAGPSRPGRYHLILFFRAETDVRYIASGTNWTVGHAVWDDGNDVADWSDAQLEQANARGRTPSRLLQNPQGMTGALVPATVIEVVAKEAAGNRLTAPAP
jgi:DNA-binding SARP family transcriptional activator